MAGSAVTIAIAQFAQQLKQKFPLYSSVPDEKLVASFVSKNPQYTANYQGTTLVSVTFVPAATAAPAQKPGVTNSVAVQPLTSSAAQNNASQPTVIRPTSPPVQNPALRPPTQHASTAVMDPPKATIVRPTASASNSPSGTKAQATPVPSTSSPGTPYLGNTVIVKTQTAPTPLMVGKYEIVDELGRGGMGLVYKAYDPGIGRTVALKVMSEQLARDTDFRERFLREARGAGILQHPNIVTVHELGEWQGAPFIAMEFLEGRSLEDILKNEKSTPLEKRLDIIAQACRGLDYAHARGIVHRDIKPANVMVTKDGVAKIVDFGIARLADQKLTHTGHVLGTVSYMSPEQLQGKTLDGRSDIFAVGVMLFEALTSVLPFSAEDTGSAITNTLYRQPPKLSNFLINYPGELDEIIAKCLAKNPSLRFQTAGELADKLNQVQQQLQRSQTAPSMIRSTPLSANANGQAVGSSPPLTAAAASQQLQQVASQSAEYAKEWWRVASPRERRNAISVGTPVLLYLIGLTASSAKFSHSGMGGGYVTSTTVALPVAILVAMIVGIQVWGKWELSTPKTQAFVGGLAFIVAAYCVDNIALGLMWYVIYGQIRLILVVALLILLTSANVGLAREAWKSASQKERSFAMVGVLILGGFFAVAFVSKLSYAGDMMHHFTLSSFFGRDGDFDQKDHAGGRKTASDEGATEPTPAYPTFDLVQTLSAGSSSDPAVNEGATKFVSAVIFSPDGNLVASADRSGTLTVWDVASGKLLQTISGTLTLKSKGLSFSPDGHWLIAAITDHEIGIWDVSTGKLVRKMSGVAGGGGGDCVSFDAKGKWLAAATCGSTVNIWDLGTGDLLHTFDAEGPVNALALAPEGLLPPYDGTAQRPKVLATGDFRGNIKLWDAEKGNLLKTIKAHQAWVSEIAFTSRGMMSSQNSGGMNSGDGLKEWNLPGGESIQAIKAGASGFVLFQDGNWLAAAGSEGRVQFWDLNTGKELRPLLAHTQNVNSVAVSPNGRWLVTGGDDKTVKVWKMK